MDNQESLSGQLSTTPLKDVLTRLSEQNHSGETVIECGFGQAKLWMRNGELIDARLGPLWAEGAIRCLLGLNSGSFASTEGPVYRTKAVREPLDTLCKNDVEPWSRMSEELPQLGAVVKLTQRPNDALIDKSEQHTLSLIDGKRSIAEIIQRSGQGPLEALRSIVSWIGEDWLSVLRSAAERSSGRPPALGASSSGGPKRQSNPPGSTTLIGTGSISTGSGAEASGATGSEKSGGSKIVVPLPGSIPPAESKPATASSGAAEPTGSADHDQRPAAENPAARDSAARDSAAQGSATEDANVGTPSSESGGSESGASESSSASGPTDRDSAAPTKVAASLSLGAKLKNVASGIINPTAARHGDTLTLATAPRTTPDTTDRNRTTMVGLGKPRADAPVPAEAEASEAASAGAAASETSPADVPAGDTTSAKSTGDATPDAGAAASADAATSHHDINSTLSGGFGEPSIGALGRRSSKTTQMGLGIVRRMPSSDPPEASSDDGQRAEHARAAEAAQAAEAAPAQTTRPDPSTAAAEASPESEAAVAATSPSDSAVSATQSRPSDAPSPAAANVVVNDPAAGTPSAETPPAEMPPAEMQVVDIEQRRRAVIASAMTQPVAAAMPKAFGRYQVISRIGQGDFGNIYLVRAAGALGFDRCFALEVLSSSGAADFERNLSKEDRIALQLEHPNVVGVVDLGVHHGHVFVVTDYVAGTSLSTLLDQEADQATPERVVAVVLDCLAGLHAIASLKDEGGQPLEVGRFTISPSNVIVGLDGIARVRGFGARRLGTALGVAPVNNRELQPYCSPEVAQGQAGDQRSDVFSMGVLLWTALTHESLFDADTPEEIRSNLLSKVVPVPSSRDTRPPASLDPICTKALARAPDQRYQSAQEMVEELRSVAVKKEMLGSPTRVAEWVADRSSAELEFQRLSFLTMSASVEATPAPSLDDLDEFPTQQSNEKRRGLLWAAAGVLVGFLGFLSFSWLAGGDEARTQRTQEHLEPKPGGDATEEATAAAEAADKAPSAAAPSDDSAGDDSADDNTAKAEAADDDTPGSGANDTADDDTTPDTTSGNGAEQSTEPTAAAPAPKPVVKQPVRKPRKAKTSTANPSDPWGF